MGRFLVAFLGTFVFISGYSQTCTVVFIDKSSSVSFVNNDDKVKSVLVNLGSSFAKPKDELYCYYIHNNTSGAVPELKLIAPSKPIGKSQLEQNKIENQYKNNLKQASQKFANACYSKINAPKNGVTSGGTDIFGLLVALSGLQNVFTEIHVLVFSDMIHDFKNKKVNPRTMQSARSEAKSDYAFVLSNYDIDLARLKGVKIEYVLPYNPAASTHNPYLDTYWRELFSAFGIACIKHN